jgi:murein L,D-transpeptidase YafK
MKTKLCIIAIALTGLAFALPSDFLSDQKKNPRVALAYSEKESILASRLKEMKLSLDDIHIILIAFKNEKELDLFVKGKAETKYKKLTTYDICRTSGELGPKRVQGDMQIPEGFYEIDKFNPASTYYLSLGINYPNSSDKIISKRKNLGGDIYIHGECVTIGCIPMTNDKIKEIYVFALQARQNGQKNIPVYIFPFRFTESNTAKFKEEYKFNKVLLDFWDNLKAGYDKFYKNFEELKVRVNKGSGKYYIQ